MDLEPWLGSWSMDLDFHGSRLGPWSGPWVLGLGLLDHGPCMDLGPWTLAWISDSWTLGAWILDLGRHWTLDIDLDLGAYILNNSLDLGWTTPWSSDLGSWTMSWIYLGFDLGLGLGLGIGFRSMYV